MTRTATITATAALVLLLAMNGYQTYVIWRTVDALEQFNADVGDALAPLEEDTWLYDEDYQP